MDRFSLLSTFCPRALLLGTAKELNHESTKASRQRIRRQRRSFVRMSSTMKPLSLLMLLAAVLLTSHIAPSVCRPRDLAMFDGHGYQSQLDKVLMKAGDNAVSYLIGEKILRYLLSNPRLQTGIPPQFPFEVTPLGSKGHRTAHSLPSLEEQLAPEEGNSLEDFLELTKRNDDPPISIDLTFHLLRNMIEMARMESQKEQAGLNRKYLDEVGK
ncbi:hypothetical protein UPYG_G00252620 [Umbra pygmaea]|uniref:Corticotropin-releasing factor domain-containing protein n=1 Tax=Umbra pygmaea TaxID=75934 RepID=A0ABD0WXS7_UMBPY